MILAAADPELGRHFSAGAYALGIVEFLLVGGLLLLILGVVWHGYVLRRIRRAVDTALDRGDERVLRAVSESEHVHNERVAVPRRLTSRSPR